MTDQTPAGRAGEPVRLSKRVAALVPCSRSEAERYIEAGWVRVDGVVVDVPQSRVLPTQSVTLDQGASLLALSPVTLVVHQSGRPLPPQLEDRWPQDSSGLRVGPAQLRQLQVLMSLTDGASGLAVYSQDHRIVRKLTEDALAIEQELVVQVTGQIAEGGLARLAGQAGQALSWRGQPLPPMKVSWQSEERLRFAFKGIDPMLVPWMCAQVGLTAVQGRRLRLGRLPLASLPPGRWRALMPHERF